MTTDDRDYYVFRLLEEDKKLLKELRSGVGTMHSAMLALVPVVEEADWPKHESPKRCPMRVPIPGELKRAMQKVKKKTGLPMVEILLRAARIYQGKNGK